MATAEALQQDWLCEKPPIAHMLSVYSSTQCTYKMQSLTMTQKDLAIDRRQIPAREKGSAQRLGDRKGSGETNTGITPHLVVLVTVQSVVLFMYLYKQNVGQSSSSGCLSSSSSSSHSCNVGVVSLPGQAGFGLPAHEGCAAQRHEVDLAGTAGAHRGEEDLAKMQTHQASAKIRFACTYARNS